MDKPSNAKPRALAFAVRVVPPSGWAEADCRRALEALDGRAVTDALCDVIAGHLEEAGISFGPDRCRFEVAPF